MTSIFNYINEEAGNKTKHQQIVDGIVRAISEKELKKGDMLPSVNMFLKKLSVARMTIVKALEVLKDDGVIEAENRIGYFVKNGEVNQKIKVMLFLTEFNVYHEVAYNEIIEGLKNLDITVDLFFHHCNPKVFKSILKENMGLYGLYVITPFDHPQVKKSLSEIPARKLLQVMRPPLDVGNSYISQDFHDDVLKALQGIREQLIRYKKFTLVFQGGRMHSKVIKQTFIEFCENCKIEFNCVDRVSKELVEANHAYFVIDDKDLIDLVKYGEEKGLKLGETLGILSYNDTPMKEIIRSGISVISTDFAEFGRAISEFIKNRQPVKRQIQTKILLRKSL